MNLARRLLGTDSDLAALMSELFDRLPSTAASESGIDPAFWDTALLDPARDILARSGKGVRSRLLERCWHVAGGDDAGPPEMLPVLVELLHVGSLVIDDIEDDSAMRRGEPALHRRYGVPIALNTGNWFYFLPMALMSRLEVPAGVRLALYEDVSVALLRCHKGQALDLSTKITQVRQRAVPGLVALTTRLKTGSLMELSATMGARAAGAAPEVVAAIGRFGGDLGVGLQMLDDWSSIAVRKRVAKGIEDVRLARPTWPWAWLAESTDEVSFAELTRQARGVSIDWEAERLLERLRAELGPATAQRIHRHLGAAFDDLRSAVGETPHLDTIHRDMQELERAYG